ncbi:hypothetical protein [Luteibacter sp. 9135]|uniref:hypothetical protein n=1 Tax=Luteibacter sp. 9135 TaxID=1500893 RepID=UPI0005607F64|nr:hypothetical protein [Luteibacter sp. 9135]
MKANTNAWFGKKRIGWGIGPRSWQGWLVIAIYTVMMMAVRIMAGASHPWLIGASTVVLTVALFTVMFLKSGRTEQHRP